MAASLKLAIIPAVAIMFYAAANTYVLAAGNRMPPADNDDSYKLPLFVPKVAQPSGGTVIFDEGKGENDEIYSLPKRGAVKPSALSPAAGPADAQKNYNQQYEEYQQQMKVYNEQMAEYKKHLAAQQQDASQPGDNDTSYVLPGQYIPARKTVKPKPQPAKPAVQAQPPLQAAQPAVQQPQTQAQPQYQPPPAAAQYNQRYNYSDESERAKPSENTAFPNYYY